MSTSPLYRVLLRLLDNETQTCRELCRMTPACTGIQHFNRSDPHPAWRHKGKTLAFNAAPDGKEPVMPTDMAKLYEDLRKTEWGWPAKRDSPIIPV